MEVIDNKLALFEVVKNLCSYLVSKTRGMSLEGPWTSSAFKALLEQSLNASVEMSSEVLTNCHEKISDLIKKLKIKDDQLKQSLELIEGILWNKEALLVLQTGTEDYESFKSRAPKCVQDSHLMTKLQEKEEMDEEFSEDIVRKALEENFNNAEEFMETKTELKKFIDRARRKYLGDKVERLLRVAEHIISCIDEDDNNDYGDILEEMFELKFHSTKLFQQIEEFQKIGSNIKRQVALFVDNLNKCKLKNDKIKNKSVLGLMRELERPDVKKAQDIQKLLDQIPVTMKKAFKTIQELIRQKLDQVDLFRAKVKELKSKYAKNKNSAPKSDTLVTEFEKIVKEYCSLDISAEDIRVDIEKHSWLVKASCALEGKNYDGTSRNLDSWKKMHDSIKDWGGSVATSIEKKIQTAKSFIREVEKIRNANPSSKIDKDKLPTLEQALDFIQDINRNCKEVDLGQDRILMENQVSFVQSKIKLASSQNVMLHDLQAAMEFLRRASLNLKVELTNLNEVEKKALDF